jgi:hypothetical protein
MTKTNPFPTHLMNTDGRLTPPGAFPWAGFPLFYFLTQSIILIYSPYL